MSAARDIETGSIGEMKRYMINSWGATTTKTGAQDLRFHLQSVRLGTGQELVVFTITQMRT